jgi:putative transposase
MSKRRTHSSEFKSRVAMEAISGRKSTQDSAADHAIHTIQLSQWKRQLLDGASELFTRGKKTKDKEGGLGVVSHQVRQRSSSASRCWGERQPRAECFLRRL